jgi:ADP-ribosyltransferase exoenzyme
MSRLTVDIDLAGFPIGVIDAKFDETKHPRGQPGNSGQFASSPGGPSGRPGATFGKAVIRAHAQMMGKNPTHYTTVQLLHALTLLLPAHKSKTDRPFLKAIAAELAARKAGKPVEGVKPKVELPGPFSNTGMQYKLYELAKAGDADKIKQVMLGLHNPDNLNYASELLNAMGEGTPASQHEKPKVTHSSPKTIEGLAKPHEASAHQKSMHIVAAGTLSIANKIIALDTILAGAPKNGYTEKYGNQLKAALLSDNPNAVPAPNPPPSSTDGTITSPRLSAQALINRFKTAHTWASTESVETASGETWEKMPAKHRDAARVYTNGAYGDMNGALRNPQAASEHIVNFINHLDDAFDSDVAKVKKDLVTYRGLKMDDSTIKQLTSALKLGLPARFNQDGFISTSFDKDKANGFGSGVRMEVLVKAGTPALYLKPISCHAGENEVLLRHGQSFELLEYRRENGKHILRVATV